MTRPARQIREAKKIGSLVRAIRKQQGASQVDFCKILDVDQSGLSRIENGSQILTAPQWLELCDHSKVSVESLRLGYIEYPQPLGLEQGQIVGGFRLPKKFSRDRGSKVRAVQPFLLYFRDSFGEKRTNEFLKLNRIDPDFFVNLENQINLGFTFELVRHLQKSGFLKNGDIRQMIRPAFESGIHGKLEYQYESQDGSGDLFKTLIKNSAHYDSNFKYEIESEGKGQLDLSVTPEPHVFEVLPKENQELGEFLCRYRKAYFSEFLSSHQRSRSMVSEVSCAFKGASRCVFKVGVAA